MFEIVVFSVIAILIPLSEYNGLLHASPSCIFTANTHAFERHNALMEHVIFANMNQWTLKHNAAAPERNSYTLNCPSQQAEHNEYYVMKF